MNCIRCQPITCLLLIFLVGSEIQADPTIPLSRSWFRNNEEAGYTNNRATDRSRGCAASRWLIEQILSRGYSLATIYYGDIDPDFDDPFKKVD